jgi:hypothetical protein
MAGQLLHVAQRTAGFDDLLGQAGDECPPARVARRTLNPEFAKPGVEPYRDGGSATSSRPLAVDKGMVRRHLYPLD